MLEPPMLNRLCDHDAQNPTSNRLQSERAIFGAIKQYLKLIFSQSRMTDDAR
jgi:hypothetical protein